MAHALNRRHLETARSSGTLLFPNGKRVEFQRVDVGQLVVTSGALAASDPLVNPAPQAFAQAIPAGSYPVSIAIARLEDGDERVAFAMVGLSSSPPSYWKMALVAGEDLTALEQDAYFGYGVDSGTGCFMDPVAGRLLGERMDNDPDYFNVIIEGKDKTYKDTRSWFDWRPSPAHNENVVCFSSGWGDGFYPSFFGFSDEGRLSALVTDFFVVSDIASST